MSERRTAGEEEALVPGSLWRRTGPGEHRKTAKEGRLIVVSLRSPSSDPKTALGTCRGGERRRTACAVVATLGPLHVALCVLKPEGCRNMTGRDDLIQDMFSFLRLKQIRRLISGAHDESAHCGRRGAVRPALISPGPLNDLLSRLLISELIN